MRIALVLTALALAGCSTATEPPPQGRPLAFYGFVGVGCGADYSAEVEGWTNVATACAPGPEVAAAVGEQLDRHAARGLAPLLFAEGVFFEASGETAPSGGPRLVLRADYQARWEALAEGAGLAGRGDALGAILVADEPTWQGIAPDDLSAAMRAVDATLPTVPLLLVEAHPVVDRFVVPPEADWVGVDRYAVADPETDPDALADLATLKARRSRPDQGLVVVMDAQWLPFYADLGLSPEAMAEVGRSWARLAQSDPAVVGVIGYLWAGGQDAPGHLSARDLPTSVREAYREIGRELLR